MNRGSLGISEEQAEELVASMRPRFMNRGSGREVVRLNDLIVASMRPRFMNRGSDAMHTSKFNDGLLQ